MHTSLNHLLESCFSWASWMLGTLPRLSIVLGIIYLQAYSARDWMNRPDQDVFWLREAHIYLTQLNRSRTINGSPKHSMWVQVFPNWKQAHFTLNYETMYIMLLGSPLLGGWTPCHQVQSVLSTIPKLFSLFVTEVTNPLSCTCTCDCM